MIVWPEPDRLLEAGPTGPRRDAQRAHRAAMEAVGEYGRLENQAAQQLMKRLDTLQQALRQRLTQQITDFKRFTLQQLLADVDRLMADTWAQIEREQAGNFGKAGAMGEDAALKPVQALRVQANPVAGLDAQIITATFGNAVDLLSVPMQQFSTEVKAALRRVVLAGDSKMEELQRLQRSIAGAGFDNAQYRAERIMRTEMGRVFNQATYAKLAGLAQQFPFLKKGWRATPGNRTRTGHAEAGRTYARGQGIPIAQRFVIRVFDERDKKAPKQIGVAQLRFPIDPETTPAGRIAASATILCRCNAFVDIDVAGYAAYAGKRVGALNLGAQPPAAPPPFAPGRGKIDPRVPYSYYRGTYYMGKDDAHEEAKKYPGAVVLKNRRGFYLQNGLGQTWGPNGWVAGGKKAKAPIVPVGAPAAAVAAPAVLPQKVGPQGPKVSAAVRAVRSVEAKVKAALAEIDKVHGDGALPSIPALGTPGKGAEAEYASTLAGRPLHLAFGRKMLANAPYMGTYHEVGHFLDQAGLGYNGGFASDGMTRAEGKAAMQDLIAALRSTKTSMALRDYRESIGAFQPAGLNTDGLPAPNVRLLTLVKYMNQRDETFARAYAQYITVKSGNSAAMRELRNLQASGRDFSQRTASKEAGYAYTGFSGAAGGARPSNSWALPWVWQDDEFGAVEQAFDRLFDVMGWRK